MKIIFGEYGSGIEELQQYFSHIPGTIRFDEMKADLLLAQEELEKYVGKLVIDETIDHYLSGNYRLPLPAEDEASGSGSGEDFTVRNGLVDHVQMAVALIGYREYALNNDATHTKTGRMARMDKESDEWTEKLIDRDDFALQRKIQRAIDRLIKYVDDNQLESWTNSALYTETRELLLWNADIFHRFHPIEYSRRLYMLLVPMIRSVQRDMVEPVIGAELWEELMERMKAGTLKGEGEQKDLRPLYDKAGYAIAYLAMSQGYSDLPIQLFPETMSRHFWSAGSGSAFVTFRQRLIDGLKADGLKKITLLENYINAEAAKDAGEEVTDEVLTRSVPDRMDAGNKFVRV